MQVITSQNRTALRCVTADCDLSGRSNLQEQVATCTVTFTLVSVMHSRPSHHTKTFTELSTTIGSVLMSEQWLLLGSGFKSGLLFAAFSSRLKRKSRRSKPMPEQQGRAYRQMKQSLLLASTSRVPACKPCRCKLMVFCLAPCWVQAFAWQCASPLLLDVFQQRECWTGLQVVALIHLPKADKKLVWAIVCFSGAFVLPIIRGSSSLVCPLLNLAEDHCAQNRNKSDMRLCSLVQKYDRNLNPRTRQNLNKHLSKMWPQLLQKKGRSALPCYPFPDQLVRIFGCSSLFWAIAVFLSPSKMCLKIRCEDKRKPEMRFFFCHIFVHRFDLYVGVGVTNKSPHLCCKTCAVRPAGAVGE